MDAYTYIVTNNEGTSWYVTTEYMDAEAMWYRGNTNLNLSSDGLERTNRDTIISNSRIIYVYRTSQQGGSYETYITSVKLVGDTEGSERPMATWLTIGLLAALVLAFILRRRGRRVKWQR